MKDGILFVKNVKYILQRMNDRKAPATNAQAFEMAFSYLAGASTDEQVKGKAVIAEFAARLHNSKIISMHNEYKDDDYLFTTFRVMVGNFDLLRIPMDLKDIPGYILENFSELSLSYAYAVLTALARSFKGVIRNDWRSRQKLKKFLAEVFITG